MQDAKAQSEQRAAANACVPRLPSDRLRPREVDANESSRQDRDAQFDSRPWPPQGSATPADLGFHVHDLPKITRTADILVVAVGHPNLVRADWIKQGAVVIDVGVNVVPSWPGQEKGASHDQDVFGGAGYHVVGDVDFEAALSVASHVTPTPGGIGPMTIAAVLHNTVQSAWGRVSGSASQSFREEERIAVS